jgi:AcrR family transcriptional regulator
MTTANPRRMPQQSRAQATVDAVLEATAQVLLKEGWEALSTNRIAREAGVSVGSLYQYFPNKQAIVRQLLMQYSEEQHAQLASNLMSLRAGMPLDETIRRVICAVIQARLSSPSLMRACFEQLPAGEQVLLLGDWSRRTTPLVEIALTSRAVDLRLQGRDLALASFILIHAVDGILHASALLDQSVIAHPDLEDELHRLVMGYLAPK